MSGSIGGCRELDRMSFVPKQVQEGGVARSRRVFRKVCGDERRRGREQKGGGEGGIV